MLDRLGIRAALAPRLRMFANGRTAMRALAGSADGDALGCTQASEIVATPGIVLVGALPAPFALATVYSAAVATVAASDDLARRFIALLGGAESLALRRAAGFDDVASLVQRPVAAADAVAACTSQRQRQRGEQVHRLELERVAAVLVEREQSASARERRRRPC